ncbi:MAG TPA: DNA-formamidopyrimidine glycosylase family protein [Polyangiaceae bacterium]|nr:DNA-formamidopyrimidine glycosylase family protein [Polyangiaceae bacterium]
MPELPDIAVYITALERRIVGRTLARVRLFSPFLLRSFEVPLSEAQGRTVLGLERLGKRIVLALDGDLFLVVHLMIAGRFQWLEPPKPDTKPGGKIALAAFDFEHGTLVLTEASKKKRASLHVVRGREALAVHDPGGLEPLAIDRSTFRAALTRENHTVKRTLTDPRVLSGIGNAYSDEILHRARLSPLKWTTRLTGEELEQLYTAMQDVLREWILRLEQQTGDAFPTKVTAFRPEMAVHGRYREPCPVCGSPVQRIVHAENESNYCARCQTGGKVLADRSLSRLMKDDWPATLEEWEAIRKPREG